MKSMFYLYQKGFDKGFEILIQSCQNIHENLILTHFVSESQNCIKTGFDTLNYMIPLYLQALSKLTWRLS